MATVQITERIQKEGTFQARKIRRKLLKTPKNMKRTQLNWPIVVPRYPPYLKDI